MPEFHSPVPVESIASRIFLLRVKKVMVDSGLAETYELNQTLQENFGSLRQFAPDPWPSGAFGRVWRFNNLKNGDRSDNQPIFPGFGL